MTLVINVTDVNDKIYAAAAGRRRAERRSSPREMTAAYVADTDAPRARAPRPRAAGLRDDGGDRRLHRGADRDRPRLRRRATPKARRRSAATSSSACARTPATARSRTAASTTWTRARASRAPERKEDPARLRAVEGAQARRGRALGLALGAGPARLAHRVLGDGREPARRRLRHPRRRLGPASSPTTRTRPRRRAPRAAPSWRALWVHNGMIQFTGEKMAKSVGNIALLHEVARAVRPRRGDHVPDRRPLPPAAGVLGGGARARRPPHPAHPRRARAASSPGEPSPPDMATTRALLRGARRRLQHAAGARVAVRVDPRGQPSPRADVGDGDLREMLGVLGLGSWRRSRPPAAPTRSIPRRRDCSSSASARGGARLRGRRRLRAGDPRASAGRSATARSGLELLPR